MYVGLPPRKHVNVYICQKNDVLHLPARALYINICSSNLADDILFVDLVESPSLVVYFRLVYISVNEIGDKGTFQKLLPCL